MTCAESTTHISCMKTAPSYFRALWANGEEELVPLGAGAITSVLRVRQWLAAKHRHWIGQVKLLSPAGDISANDTQLHHNEVLRVVIVPFAAFALSASALVEVDPDDGSCLSSNGGWMADDVCLRCETPGDPGFIYALRDVNPTFCGEFEARRVIHRDLVKVDMETREVVVKYMDMHGEVTATVVIVRKHRFLLCGVCPQGVFIFDEASGKELRNVMFDSDITSMATQVGIMSGSDYDIYVGLMDKSVLRRLTFDTKKVSLIADGQIASHAIMIYCIVVLVDCVFTAGLDLLVKKFDRQLTACLSSFDHFPQPSGAGLASSLCGRFIFYRVQDGVKRLTVGTDEEKCLACSDRLKAMFGNSAGELVGIASDVGIVRLMGDHVMRDGSWDWAESEGKSCYRKLKTLIFWTQTVVEFQSTAENDKVRVVDDTEGTPSWLLGDFHVRPDDDDDV
eukprot:GEMP01009734.1.p1 GENE.GEMP01009734.1~~GEMP01009734.1.p1  ORF type:complete len:451 (+),score=87.06 GEMP01009734.1:907-2259(+)